MSIPAAMAGIVEPPLRVAGDHGRPGLPRAGIAADLRRRADRHAPDRLSARRHQPAHDPPDRRQRNRDAPEMGLQSPGNGNPGIGNPRFGIPGSG